MKVFIGGSPDISRLSKTVERRLDCLAEEGAEFVLLDKPGASLIAKAYLEDKDNCSVNVLGYSQFRASYDHVRTSELAEWGRLGFKPNRIRDHFHEIFNADLLIFLWDVKDHLTFLNILDELIFEQGSVEVWTPCSDQLRTVASLGDISFLLQSSDNDHIPWGTDLPKGMYEEFVRKFLPSKEVADHLLLLPQNKRMLSGIILGAPYSLEMKQGAFEKLAQTQDYFHDVINSLIHGSSSGGHSYNVQPISFAYIANEIKCALESLDLAPGEVMLLGEYWYDHDRQMSDKSAIAGFAPFQNIKAVKAYIKDDIADDKDEDILYWYELEKWVPWQNDAMEMEYSFTMIKDCLVSFRRYRPRYLDYIPQEWSSVSGAYSNSDHLSLPIPYEAGDIVKIDCMPFAPPRYACLYDFWGKGNGEIDALTRLEEDGLWVNSSLNRNSIMGYLPQISLLYRIEKVNASELPVDCKFLIEVQEFVKGSKSKGELLWKALYESMKDCYTDEEIRVLLENAKQKCVAKMRTKCETGE